MVAADVHGSVRHFVAGLVPQRNPANRRLPAPAFSARHEWEGQYVILPRTEVQQFAVSANDRAAGGGDQVAMEFAPAHRARRIRELLELAPGPLSVDNMQAIHTDTLLGPWPLFRSMLSGLDVQDLSKEAKDLRVLLLDWDGLMEAGSHRAAVFAAWRGALVQRLARHSALAPLNEPTGYSPLFGPWLSVASRVGFALETLLVRGSELGISVGVEAAAALEDAALEESMLNGAAWGGDRHKLLPVHVLPGPLATSAPTATSVEIPGVYCAPRASPPASMTVASAGPWPATCGTWPIGRTAAGSCHSAPPACLITSTSPTNSRSGQPGGNSPRWSLNGRF